MQRCGLGQPGRHAQDLHRPDPDGAGPAVPRVDERVYDAAGRVVASRIGADAWTCATYDPRGRPLSRSVPAAGAAARTVSYAYSSVLGDPLTTSVSDPAGTITTTVDLLGRVVAYHDVTPLVLTDTTTTVPRVLPGGATTTSTYDQAGRATATDGPAGVQETTYDAAGRPTAQRLDGAGVAVATTTPPASCKASPTSRVRATGPTPRPCRPSATTRPGAAPASPGPWPAGSRSPTR